MKKVGLQLYSIRDAMEKDVPGSLKKVRDMGYEDVEFAGYFGYSAEELRNMMDELGLKCVSVHQSYQDLLDKPEETIAYLKTLGVKYFVVPYMGKENHKGGEFFEKTVENFKNISALLKASGMKLLYHNHEFEFEKYEDKFLLDWLFETVGPENLETEIDTCWVKYAGYSPEKYILQHKGCAEILHLKDFVGNTGLEKTRDENNFSMKPIGEGCQDWESILSAAEEAGTEYFIVEQDDYFDTNSLDAVKRSRDYLKSIGY